MVKFLLVERYKGVRGVGGDGSGGLFRELVPNLVVVHPLSSCRDTLIFGQRDLEAKEGSSSSPIFIAIACKEVSASFHILSHLMKLKDRNL